MLTMLAGMPHTSWVTSRIFVLWLAVGTHVNREAALTRTYSTMAGLMSSQTVEQRCKEITHTPGNNWRHGNKKVLAVRSTRENAKCLIRGLVPFSGNQWAASEVTIKTSWRYKLWQPVDRTERGGREYLAYTQLLLFCTLGGMCECCWTQAQVASGAPLLLYDASTTSGSNCKKRKIFFRREV